LLAVDIQQKHHAVRSCWALEATPQREFYRAARLPGEQFALEPRIERPVQSDRIEPQSERIKKRTRLVPIATAENKPILPWRPRSGPFVRKSGD